MLPGLGGLPQPGACSVLEAWRGGGVGAGPAHLFAARIPGAPSAPTCLCFSGYLFFYGYLVTDLWFPEFRLVESLGFHFLVETVVFP